MPASKFELPVENPSGLIRSRIGEKRIFEARFLCRQLGAEIGEREKAALERELVKILAQVEGMQQQAREYVAQGQNNLAETLYADIERIAIDVPGLAEEKKALTGAEALIARIAGKAVERKREIVPQTVAPAEPDALAVSNATMQDQLKPRWKLLPYQWLIVGFFSLVIILLFFLRSGQDAKSLPAAPKPSLLQSAPKKIIKPVVPAPSAIDQAEKEAEQGTPVVEEDSPPSSSLNVGTLQVKDSAHD